jgi:hypothetical protein
VPTGAALPQQRKNPKTALDTPSRRHKIARNEPDAKAILPEPRSVEKAISYQLNRAASKKQFPISVNWRGSSGP